MTRTCTYCGETSPATLSNCPSCGRSFALGQIEQVMTPPRGVSAETGAEPDALYTKLALKAVDLSDTFNALFAEPMPGWQVEMGRPGMSTAGGRQALQHIGLRGPKGGTIVVGTVDQAAGRAEVRGYRRVDAMYRERYGRPIPIRAADWDRFTQRLVQFLSEEDLVVSVDTRPPRRAADDDWDDAPRGLPFAWVLIGVLGVALTAGAITWILMTRRPAPSPQSVPGWPAPTGSVAPGTAAWPAPPPPPPLPTSWPPGVPPPTP